MEFLISVYYKQEMNHSFDWNILHQMKQIKSNTSPPSQKSPTEVGKGCLTDFLGMEMRSCALFEVFMANFTPFSVRYYFPEKYLNTGNRPKNK